MTECRKTRYSPPPPAARGLTLVELLVSLTILAVMVLVVNQVLSSSRQAINASQNTTLANANARAAIENLRDDLARMSKDGFLAILGPAADGSTPPVLMFTAVGPYRNCTTAYPNQMANAAVICYTIREDASSGTSPNNRVILCREANLLTVRFNTAVSDGSTAWTDDLMQRYLAHVRAYTRTQLAWNNIIQYRAAFQPPLKTVPDTLADVNALWPYMISPVRRLTIEWQDAAGTWHGWNGYDASGAPTYNGSPISLPGFLDENQPNCDAQTEWQWPANRAYAALFTWKRKDLWPVALRISFDVRASIKADAWSRSYQAVLELTP